MTKSPWRLHSRRVIAETLAGLPAAADEKACRKALRGLCPPQPRHGHQMYLLEVKQALDQRFGKARRRSAELDARRVAPCPAGVLCDWCEAEGCIACAQIRCERAAFLADDPRRLEVWWRWFMHFLAHPEDVEARKVFADWLEEEGWPEQAARERKVLT